MDDDLLPKLIYSRSSEGNQGSETPIFRVVEQNKSSELNGKSLQIVEEDDDDKIESSNNKNFILKNFSEKATFRTFKTKRVIDSLEILRNNRNAKQMILKSEEQFNRFKKTLIEYGYDDISLLGEGGTGLVLRAKNIKKDEIVALKFQYIGEEGVLEEDFKNEAEIMHTHSKRLAEDLTLKSIKIYNKVILIDKETNTKLSVIEMEIAKDTLENIIKKMRKEKKQFDGDQISKIFTDLIEALYYLHSQNIAHNDIKPANIFLIDNCFTLADFGICRRVNVAETHAKRGCTLEVRMPLCGTYFYMSPQMRSGFEDYQKSIEMNKNTEEFEMITLDCFKSDIYSLGIVILELISVGDITDKHFSNAVLMRDASFHELIKRYKITSQDETYVQIDKGFLKIPNLLEFMLRENEEERCTVLDLCSYCNLKDCFIAPVVTPLLEVFTPIVERIEERLKKISYVTKPAIYEGETAHGTEFQKNGWGVLYRLERERKGDKITEKKIVIYEGNWKHDLPHGNGSMRLGDMFNFKGKFKKGVRHGDGMLFFKDQLVQEGFWVSNTFPQYCGMVYDNLDDMFEFIPTGHFIPLPYMNTKLAWKQDKDLKGRILIDFYLNADTNKDRKFLRDKLLIFFSLKNERVIRSLQVKRKVLSDGPSIFVNFFNFGRLIKFLFRGLKDIQEEIEIIKLCEEIISVNLINSFSLDLWKNSKLPAEVLQGYQSLSVKACSRITNIGFKFGFMGINNSFLVQMLPKINNRNGEAKYLLTELDISDNKDITDEILNLLSESRSGVMLHSLNLKGCCQITEDSLIKFVNAPIAKNLQKLYIDGNENISLDLLRSFVGKKSKENITVLSLSSCFKLFKRDRESWYHLKTRQTSFNELIFPLSLQDLNLSHTSINDELLQKFPRELKNLTKLSLRGCDGVTDTGIHFLCSNPSMKTLQHLDIGLCKLMNAVLEYLGKSLIIELKSLNLDGLTALDERGMYSLIKEKVYAKLETLQLSDTGVCGKCLKLLQKHPNAANIKTLSFSNCKKIGVESLRKFIICGKFLSLSSLNLDYIEFGFRLIMNTLEKKECVISTLRRLSIRKNNIDSREVLLKFVDSERLKKLNKLIVDIDVEKCLVSSAIELKNKTLKINKDILLKSDRSKPRLIVKDLSSSEGGLSKAINPHLKIDNEVMKSLLYHGETVSKIAKLNLEGFKGINDIGIKYLVRQDEKLYNLKVLKLKNTSVGSVGMNLILTSFLVYTLEILDTRDCIANEMIDVSQIRRHLEESFIFELRNTKARKANRKICLIRNLYEANETEKSLGKQSFPFKRKENILVWIGDNIVDSTNSKINIIELEKNRCTFFILHDESFLKSFLFNDYYKALVAISQENTEEEIGVNVVSQQVESTDYAVLCCELSIKHFPFKFELATFKRTQKLKDDSVIYMVESLNKYKSLRSVKITLDRVEESLDYSKPFLLCKAFQVLTKLKKLDISLLGRNIQPSAVDRAVILISGLGTLTELKEVYIHFEKGILNKEHVENLNLDIFSQVEVLELTIDESCTKGGTMGRVGIKIGTILEKFSKLKSLKLGLRANKLDIDGTNFIFKALSKMTNLSLLHLNLQRNFVGESARTLAKSLQTLINLKELYLYLEDNAIGKDSSSSLSFSISKLVSLTVLHLDLVKNKIENDGALAIGLALKDLVLLRALNLNLKSLLILKYLDLLNKFNFIKAKGLETLKKSLPNLSHLEHLTLNLHDNNIDEKEITLFLNDCSKLINLKTFDLDIRDNDIDKDLYSIFNNTICLMTKVETLHLKLQEKSFSYYGINSLIGAFNKLEHLSNFHLMTRNLQYCKDLFINLGKSDRLAKIKQFHLHLPDSFMVKEDINNLSNILIKMRSLEDLSLNLEKDRLDEDNSKSLALGIGSAEKLSALELELCENAIGEAADIFLDKISELLLLENLKIDFRNNRIDVAGIKNIGKFCLLSNLRYLLLNLSQNILEGEAALYVVSSLKGLDDIGSLILNLSENAIDISHFNNIRNIISPLINASLDI